MSIVEEGEDGFLAKDASSGRVRYVHDPLVGEDGDLTKSLMLLARPENVIGGSAIDRLVAMRRAELSPLAKAIKGGAGLALQPVTTSKGVQTKRWKRTAPKEKKERPAAKPELPPEHRDAAPGDKVSFKKGTVTGEGQIVAHGHKGAHVKDAEGEIHKVDWKHVQAREKPAEKPKAPEPRKDGESDKEYAKRVVDHEDAPEHLPERHEDYFNTKGASKLPISNLRSSKSDEENKQGGSNGPKRMAAAAQGRLGKRQPIKVHVNEDGTHTVVDGNGTFTTVKQHDWKHIPAHVVQPHETPDEIMQAGTEAVEHLKTWLNKGSGICDQMGHRTMTAPPDKTPNDEYAKPGGMLFIAPMKTMESSERKVRDEYEGDWSRLKDAARCTVAVDTVEEMRSVITKLHASGMVIAQPPKDRYANGPTPLGYRDVNMIIRAPNGHLTEVQVNTKAMMVAKNDGHKAYEVSRALTGKYKNKPVDEWSSEEDQAAYKEAVETQLDVYGEAYAKISGKA